MKNRIEEEYNRREVKLVRLNKYISDAGICSRREADRLIEAGKVKIDGVTPTKLPAPTHNKIFHIYRPPVIASMRNAKPKPCLRPPP